MTVPSCRVANDLMPESLSQRTRYLILATVVAVLLYALLFYTPRIGGLWSQVFYDSLHVPVFGLIAVSFYFLWRPDWARSQKLRLVAAFAAACALGLVSEIAQMATSRDASVSDFIADCLGAAGFLGITVALFPAHPLAWPRRALAAAAALIMLGWALAPLTLVSAAYLDRNAQFPVIFSPDSAFGRKLLRLQNIRYEIVVPPETDAAHAVITFLDAPWPGIAMHDLSPDWTAYGTLVIDLEVGGANPLDINLRVHDATHRQNQVFNDRFNRTFNLEPGRHTLEIPLADLHDAPQGRAMDLAKVSELIIFGAQANAGRSFRLYSVRLE